MCIRDRYSNATLITPNRHEFRSIVGAEVDEADMKVRAENLRKQLNIDAILVTRSEQGMTLFSNEGSSHTPTLAREVFDVSGAGDTVIAIMGVMLASGEKMEAAVRWANKAAGIVVGKLGTAVVTPDELFQ